jgi:hypothetical protein
VGKSLRVLDERLIQYVSTHAADIMRIFGYSIEAESLDEPVQSSNSELQGQHSVEVKEGAPIGASFDSLGGQSPISVSAENVSDNKDITKAAPIVATEYSVNVLPMAGTTEKEFQQIAKQYSGILQQKEKSRDTECRKGSDSKDDASACTIATPAIVSDSNSTSNRNSSSSSTSSGVGSDNGSSSSKMSDSADKPTKQPHPSSDKLAHLSISDSCHSIPEDMRQIILTSLYPSQFPPQRLSGSNNTAPATNSATGMPTGSPSGSLSGEPASLMINEAYSIRRDDDDFGRKMTDLRRSYTDEDKNPFPTVN